MKKADDVGAATVEVVAKNADKRVTITTTIAAAVSSKVPSNFSRLKSHDLIDAQSGVEI